MINIIEIILLVVAGFFIVYLTALSILALFARKEKSTISSGIRRFAIVVPAHNEEIAIERTLKSLLAIDYPKGYFDVMVVADNCTDRTAVISRSCGAMVYERTNTELRGKGYALRWCFDQILVKKPTYDGIVVIDADSIASSNFLSVMNYYLEQGADAVQCSDMVAPQPGAWSSEITRLGFTLYNHVRPLARRLFGFSAGLRGNGMCFAADTLREVPWNTYSLNEDLEYGLVLLLHNKPIVFAPEAKVLATMPATPANAESQRSRWEKGRSPVIRRYFFPLLRAAWKNMSLKPLDALIDLIIPPFVNLVAVIVAVLGISILLAIFGVSEAIPFVLPFTILLILSFLHVLIGLYASNADRDLYSALLLIPRYAMWKLFLYVKIFGRGTTTEWVRTTREETSKSSLDNEGVSQ